MKYKIEKKYIYIFLYFILLFLLKYNLLFQDFSVLLLQINNEKFFFKFLLIII